MLGADFLKSKHVWLGGVDDLGQSSDPVVVLLLRCGCVHMAHRNRFLTFPCHHR